MPVTIKDIARESAVNVSTVSRALSGSYGVHAKTRAHVLAVAARLNYRPNRVARGLATGRSHTLGLIVSDIRNPFFAEVARGAEDAARAGGCDLILCNSDLDAEKQMRYVRSLLEMRVDGIMMNSVATLEREHLHQLATCTVPIVLLNRTAPEKLFSTVNADNEAGGVIAAEYLLRLGHRRIAHLSGPRRHGNMTDRARGFARVINGNASAKLTLIRGENTFAGGYELAKELLQQKPEPTAIFAASDLMAFGVLRAMIELGRRVPEDISVLGFDDIELAGVVQPPLSTIRQPKYELGKAAAEILLAHSGDKSKRGIEHRTFGVELVERKSCRTLP
ncbi:MAG: LacI family DNA-binding transcriptional regulator [Undibacterium sp.]|nr:LacI family DNA-binding transcriptional regulator [Opitutaceae bacterium]